MDIVRVIFVLIPAFFILHLTVAGFAVPAVQAGPDFMNMFEISVFQLTLLALAPALGYVASIPKGAVMAVAWSPRWVMVMAFLLSFVGCALFAFVADGFWMMLIALLLVGSVAGIVLPLTARLLGGLNNIASAGLVGVLILLAWVLSLLASHMFATGLPIPGPPGWAGTFLVQGAFLVLWFLPVLLFMPKQPLGR